MLHNRSGAAIPTNVPPKAAAVTSALTLPGTSPDKVMPAARSIRADASRVGRLNRRARAIHNAEPGMAASPTTTQAPAPTQPGASRVTEATRKVPAIM